MFVMIFIYYIFPLDSFVNTLYAQFQHINIDNKTAAATTIETLMAIADTILTNNAAAVTIVAIILTNMRIIININIPIKRLIIF